jgi:hypothetical protein
METENDIGIAGESGRMKDRMDFSLFKSNVCHEIHRRGDLDFIVDTLKSGTIREYWRKERWPECLYLLAMVDYLSRENGLPRCSDYDDIRNCRLRDTVYPLGVVAMCSASNSDAAKTDCLKEAIPEFLKYNIVEAEIRNVR